MKKVFILCLLGLILLPAAVMAAGPHGQGNNGAKAGSPAVQEESAATADTQGQYQARAWHGLTDSSPRGQSEVSRPGTSTGIGNQVRTLAHNQTRIREGIGDQVRTLARNQTRLRDGSCGLCPPSGN
ncbi:MAG: hypothetical protein NQU46_07375 [Methanolinea sp.]|nr:hypothetical protein [Methanolinea sp.]